MSACPSSSSPCLALISENSSRAPAAAFSLRLRILRFPLPEQALHILVILLVGSGITVVLNLIVDATFPGYTYFIGAIIGALLWPSMVWLIELPEAIAAKSEVP